MPLPGSPGEAVGSNAGDGRCNRNEAHPARRQFSRKDLVQPYHVDLAIADSATPLAARTAARTATLKAVLPSHLSEPLASAAAKLLDGPEIEAERRSTPSLEKRPQIY